MWPKARFRNAATRSSRPSRMRDTSDFEMPVSIPIAATRSSTARVDTPDRYASITTAYTAWSIRRRRRHRRENVKRRLGAMHPTPPLKHHASQPPPSTSMPVPSPPAASQSATKSSAHCLSAHDIPESGSPVSSAAYEAPAGIAIEATTAIPPATRIILDVGFTPLKMPAAPKTCSSSVRRSLNTDIGDQAVFRTATPILRCTNRVHVVSFRRGFGAGVSTRVETAEW